MSKRGRNSREGTRRLCELVCSQMMEVAWPEIGCVARNTQKMKESCCKVNLLGL